MKTLRILSPSKINLTLRVNGKRDDGYHNIRSIFQPINLFDELEINIEDGEGLEVEVFGVKIPGEGDNIVERAASLYLKSSNLKKNILIRLFKKIPIGAGLGGGSGNAAAVLTGLNKIFSKLDDTQIMFHASELGSDVPFFIRSCSALVEGRGEKLKLLHDFPLFHYVLLCPRLQISTREIYDNYDMPESFNHADDMDSILNSFSDADQLPLYNDLEKPAFSLYPQLEKYKQMFYSLEVDNVIMTGSGSTIAGVFRNEKEADEVYNYLNVSGEFDVYKVNGIKGWHYPVE